MPRLHGICLTAMALLLPHLANASHFGSRPIDTSHLAGVPVLLRLNPVTSNPEVIYPRESQYWHAVFSSNAWTFESFGTAPPSSLFPDFELNSAGVPFVLTVADSFMENTGSGWTSEYTFLLDPIDNGIRDMAIDPLTGNPYIAYYEQVSSSGNVNLRWNWRESGSWSTQSIDIGDRTPISGPSLKFQTNGMARVAYVVNPPVGQTGPRRLKMGTFIPGLGGGWSSIDLEVDELVDQVDLEINPFNQLPEVTYIRNGTTLIYGSFVGGNFTAEVVDSVFLPDVISGPDLEVAATGDTYITYFAFDGTIGRIVRAFRTGGLSFERFQMDTVIAAGRLGPGTPYSPSMKINSSDQTERIAFLYSVGSTFDFDVYMAAPVNSSVAVPRENARPAFSVWPSPIHSGGDLRLRLPAGATSVVSVHDLSGRRILERAVSGPSASLSLHGTKPGVYFIHAVGAWGRAVEKVVIVD